MHTREIAAYGGLVNRMPLYALVFMVFTMANVGLPGTSGFVGEFMTLLGTFKVSIPTAFLRHARGHPVGVLRTLALPQGGVLSAGEAVADHIKDLTFRECLTLFPADRADDPVRRLPEAGARHVGGVGSAARQQLRKRGDGGKGRGVAAMTRRLV